jgi:hypothetical protein
MARLEFETALKRERYRVVKSSVAPNTLGLNHCHDFDARMVVLGGEITLARREGLPEPTRNPNAGPHPCRVSLLTARSNCAR